MSGDRAVFTAAISILLVLIGMGIGEDKTRTEIASVCKPQPGATLASSYQDKAGVLCLYVETSRPEYGRAVRKQKATRT